MRRRTLYLIAALGLATAIVLILFSKDQSSETDIALRAETPPKVSTRQAPKTFIAGYVVDPLGEGIAGATVELLKPARTVEADSEGYFKFEALRHGTYDLSATADGFVVPGPPAIHSRQVTLGRSASIEDLVLTLREPGVVSGRVVAAGTPVEARLSIVYLGAEGLGGITEPFSLDGVASTGSDGAFTLDSVAPGRFRLFVEPDEYSITESRVLTLEDGQRLSDLVIDVSPAGRLTGIVSDSEGSGISGVEIILHPEDSRARRTRSTQGGKFEFDRLPARQARVEFRAPGFRTEGIDVTIEVDSVERLEVELEATEGLYGRVIDSTTRRGIEPAFVTYKGQRHTSRTDADGTFEWPEAPDDLEAIAVSPFHGSSSETQVVKGVETVFELTQGGWVEGRVRNGAGQPITDFTVVVETFEVDGPRPYTSRVYEPLRVSHSQGRFRFGPVRPGTYDFRARADGLADGTSPRMVVRRGATAVGADIVLEEGATISGTVENEAGEPVVNALVQEFSPLSSLQNQRARTGADGSFELSGLAPGRRSLRVNARGYIATVVSGLEVGPAQELRQDVVLSEQKEGETLSFAGIGAVLRRHDDGVVIQSTLDDQPAQIHGLEQGDVIVSVDGDRTSSMRFDRVIEMIRGKPGEPVMLEIDRDGEGRMKIEVERGKVVVDSR